ncbi:MAG TPA: hypothetical protein VG675_06375 [Bryobacteraceae bacterium]|nr:hypothetical protein [Bryobacteraceae bacterium]
MGKKLLLFLAASALATAAPVINSGGVVNAASNAPLGGANSGIAEGSFFSIYGTGLGPASPTSASAPLGTSLGGTTVAITPVGGGAPVQAIVYFTYANQVNGILPSNTPVGDANVTVTFGGATSAPVKIRVVKSSFGIFTFSYGSGPAAAQNYNSATDTPVNSLTNAVNPGQVMILYGTGLGPITGPDNVPPGAVSPVGIGIDNVRVLVGGQSITPLYAGRTPSYPAEDQINFQLPSDASVADGCFVPIAVSVNGVVSNYATIAKATGSRTCPAPLGLSTSDMQKLDQGGSLKIGVLDLYRSSTQGSFSGISFNSISEGATGLFTAYGASGLYSLTSTPGAVAPFSSFGTCTVTTVNSTSTPTSTLPPALSTPLNAGSSLALSGPNNKSASLPFSGTAGYSVTLAQSNSIPGLPGGGGGGSTLPTSFLEAGTWTMTGTGGTDVGPFTAKITIPTALNCTNCASISTIDRSQPLTINWTGGGGDQDYVIIGGESSAPSVADATKTVAVLFYCVARASDQHFTVPANVLGQLPATTGDITSGSIGALILLNGLSGTQFTAPLTAGGNLDLGYFSYVNSAIQLATYK